MSNLSKNTTDLQAILAAVNALPEAGSGGVELPELTNEGTAADLLSGKELIDGEGNVVTGTITTRTTSDLTANNATVIVPAGYYATQTLKAVSVTTQATPSITVSSAGLITASATQSAGYVAAGTKSATKQLTTQAAKTITPTKSSQTAVASGRYTTGAVTVAAIPAQYITTTDATATAADIRSGKTAYVNGSKVGGTMADFDGSYECSGDSTGGSSGGASITSGEFIVTDNGMYEPGSNEYVLTASNNDLNGSTRRIIILLVSESNDPNGITSTVAVLYRDNTTDSFMSYAGYSSLVDATIAAFIVDENSITTYGYINDGRILSFIAV